MRSGYAFGLNGTKFILHTHTFPVLSTEVGTSTSLLATSFPNVTGSASANYVHLSMVGNHKPIQTDAVRLCIWPKWHQIHPQSVSHSCDWLDLLTHKWR
jgi:hypothetical protein